MARVQLVDPRAATQRLHRRPETHFSLIHRPWQLTPFCCFPVLPGETMKMSMFQSRVVSDPVANPLIGAHIEYYLYYVKLRDIPELADAINSMILDPEYDAAPLRSAASIPYFHQYGINWAKAATDQAITDHWRLEGQTASDFMIGDYPAASIRLDNWLDSSLTEAEYDPVGDTDVDLNADGNITIEEIRQAQRAYDLARQMNLTDMTFEDYLRTYGVNIPSDAAQMTEELRYIRNWAYPTNTVDPATGAPSSAFSWSVAERADKDRRFNEFGFVVGLTVFRPKVYLSNQSGSVTGLMDNVYRWLPAIMENDPETSFLHVADPANGPLRNQGDGYWFDLKDLFLYGEQFVNHQSAGWNQIAMPTAAHEKFFPTSAMADSIFKSSEANKIRQDGIINLDVLGHVIDTTPTSEPPNLRG